MIKLSNALLLTLLVQLAAYAQEGQSVLIQDDARVGLIVTGEGNTLHTTQIFGKSPEYAELKSALDEYDEQIGDKADLCDEMEDDGLPARYIENCTAELARLNRKRDSIQKIEAKFRTDVLRLAALFDQVEVNSERILIAQRLFEEGQITEADAILRVGEMQTETDQLLAKRARLKDTQQETDSLLTVKSEEWLTKAILTEIKHDLENWQDSVLYYYQQSIRCKERFTNLLNYAGFFYQHNQLDSAELYLDRLVTQFGEEFTVEENIAIYDFFGRLYTLQNQDHSAEEAYLKALSFIQERESSDGDSLLDFKSHLLGNLGVIYRSQGRLDLAEQYQLESLHLTRQVLVDDTISWQEDLAMNHSNLGEVYRSQGNYDLALEQYRRALQIRRALVKEAPLKFEGQVGKSLNSLGGTLRLLGRLNEALDMLKEGEQIWIRLERINKGRFAHGLSLNQNALGSLYMLQGNYEASESAYKNAIRIRRKLAEVNPSPFLSDLATALHNLGVLYNRLKKPDQAKLVILESIQSFEKLEAMGGIVNGQKLYEAYGLLSGTLFLAGKWDELKLAYKKMIELGLRLAENDPETFELEMAQTAFFSAYVNLQTSDQAAALQDLEITKTFTIKYFETLQAKQIFTSMISYFGWGGFDSTLVHIDQEYLQLRQAFFSTTDPAIQVAKLKQIVDLYEQAIQAGNNSKYLIGVLAMDYSDLSNCFLLIQEFESAVEAARKAIELDPTQPQAYVNLATALLFDGQYDEAAGIYQEKKGQVAKSFGSYSKSFLKIIEDLQDYGITHPDVEKIYALLAKD